MVVCTFIWLNLGRSAQIFGFAWMAVGLLLYMFRRKIQTAPVL
jgi:hypothetical protein